MFHGRKCKILRRILDQASPKPRFGPIQTLNTNLIDVDYYHVVIHYFGHFFLSVCLCVCYAVTFDSLDLASSFLVCRFIFRIVRSGFVYEGHLFKVKVTGAKKL